MTPLVWVGVLALAGGLGGLLMAAVWPARVRIGLAQLDPTAVAGDSRLTGATGGTTALVERLLTRHSVSASFAGLLERAGVQRTPAEVVVLTGGGALGIAALALLLEGPLAAVVLVVLVPLAARAFLGFRVGRRQAAFADQLDDALQLMAGSLRAGHSLLRALDSVAGEAQSPTSEEFARVVNETRVGRELNDSLEEVAARTQSEDFAWVTQAIAIHREVGGNLAEVLDQVGQTIRERNQIRRQVKALAAEGKLSAYVLMALPIGIAGFLSMSNPEYIGRLTEEFLGWVMLGTGVVMLTIGGLWLRSTVKIAF